MIDLLTALQTEKRTIENRIYTVGVSLANKDKFTTPYTQSDIDTANIRLAEVNVAIEAIKAHRKTTTPN